MTIKLRNSWHDNGGGWWTWKAFLDDGGSGELDQVEFVEYVLHPTFPNSIRRVKDSIDGFALETTGWGMFKIKAFVNMKNGEKRKLIHDLVLSSNPPEGVTP
jgi:transcription initiation factor IIF auxiliary subunit